MTPVRPPARQGFFVSESFHGILEPRPDVPTWHESADVLHDLNLDQVIASITTGWERYELTELFRTRLLDLDAVTYRQEVMRELEAENVMASITAFSGRMLLARSHLEMADDRDCAPERHRWFLDAALTYCDAVRSLAAALQSLPLASRGLRAFREYLTSYAVSSPFAALSDESHTLDAKLSAVRYSLLIRDATITVAADPDDSDYTADVEATFEKFRRETAKDYRVRFPDAGRLNHIEAQVLEYVAQLNPELFASLATFCTTHTGFIDAGIARFDREVQFYVSYLRFMHHVRSGGLPFCYPRLAPRARHVAACTTFDLALAAAPSADGDVVCNDFALQEPERVFVVSGPNHGGKTTFARLVGQLHHLAALGCPVPGTEARLQLCDRIFTHFARSEEIASLRGRLQDDLMRMRVILDGATADSLVILNEIFSSTTLYDAVTLSRRIMAALSRRDVLAVWVTFLDELASFDEKTVSFVAGVDPNDPTVRTFRLERRPADGLAFAMAVADKYRVTYRWLRERIRP